MKKCLVLYLLIIRISNSDAQWVFQRTYGTTGNERCQSAFSFSTGGFLLNGATTAFGTGDVDALIVRTDETGSITWAKTCGASDNETPLFVSETFNHNLVFSGTIGSPVPGSVADALIFKTDSSGIFLWAKSFGANGNETAVRVEELPDHGYAVTGTTDSYGAGSSDIYFLRTDQNGDTLFTGIYGSADNEQGKSFLQTSDGGFLITGKSYALSGGIPLYRAILIRIDSAGNLKWSRLYGDSLFQEAQSAVQLEDGGFMVCGSRDLTGSYDILVYRTDSMGYVQWSKTYGGSKGEASYTILKNPDNTFVLSGYTNSMGYGHQLSVHETGYADIFVQRNSYSPANRPLGDDSTNIFLMKIDDNGDTLWTKTYGYDKQDEAFLSSKTPDGGYMLTGFNDYHQSDSMQMLIIKTDGNGKSGCYEYDSHPQIVSSVLSAHNANYLQSSGMDVHTVVLTSNPVLIDDSVYCLFTGLNEVSFENKFEVFPSPSSKFINLKCNGLSAGGYHISMINMIGEKIFPISEYQTDMGIIQLDISGISNGIYLVEIQAGPKRFIQKFVKN